MQFSRTPASCVWFCPSQNVMYQWTRLVPMVLRFKLKCPPKLSCVWKVIGSWSTVLTSGSSMDQFCSLCIARRWEACWWGDLAWGRDPEGYILIPSFSALSKLPGCHGVSSFHLSGISPCCFCLGARHPWTKPMETVSPDKSLLL